MTARPPTATALTGPHRDKQWMRCPDRRTGMRGGCVPPARRCSVEGRRGRRETRRPGACTGHQRASLPVPAGATYSKPSRSVSRRASSTLAPQRGRRWRRVGLRRQCRHDAFPAGPDRPRSRGDMTRRCAHWRTRCTRRYRQSTRARRRCGRSRRGAAGAVPSAPVRGDTRLGRLRRAGPERE